MDLFGKKKIAALEAEILKLKQENTELRKNPNFKQIIEKINTNKLPLLEEDLLENHITLTNFITEPEKSFKTPKEKGDYLEKFISTLFKEMGYKTQLTNIDDNGIDVIAQKDNEKLIIQCKNYTVNKEKPNFILKKDIDIFKSSDEKGQKVFIANTFFKNQNTIKKYPDIIFLDRRQLFELIHYVVPNVANHIYFKKHLKEINLKICPECKKGYLIKRKSSYAPYGHFLGCTRFPNCMYTKNTAK